MAGAPVNDDGGRMLLAGVIQLSAAEIALIVAVFLVVALAFAAVGGAIAVLVARRRVVFWLGSVAGWISSAFVGLLLRRSRTRSSHSA
jgi:hypothetical protein